MPGKKKKYNARFPPARIKKIMQSDDEVGKVAAPVPVIISRALEMFAETLLQRARKVTSQRGARTLTPSHLKFCIQSEARFDFLKEMVGSVPELQGDMDVEGGLGVMGERPSDGRLGGVGRARGVGRATVPGTGKRRGRPPKMAGAPPSARTKRSVEKFVDEQYDCGDIVEIDSDQWPSAKKFCNGTTSNPGQSPSPSQSPQERLFHPQPDASHRLNSFSSPFNIQRSVSQNDFAGSKIVPTRSTSSSASSSSLCQPSLQLETSKDKTDSPSPVSGETSSYQRTNSLPPPAPVYTGTYSRLFRSTSTTGGSLQGPLHGSLTSNRNGGAGPAFKVQTNGNLTLTGLERAPPGQTNPSGPGQELDEDYDC